MDAKAAVSTAERRVLAHDVARNRAQGHQGDAGSVGGQFRGLLRGARMRSHRFQEPHTGVRVEPLDLRAPHQHSQNAPRQPG
ncbi:hypothetical protein ABZ953_32845 [Streptomyces sp. NPDC046465]|uniref:hypothetical protein n=1 Tax=Streptomyces sp. NPDC046465 TaxID=3155810 RepID=UPI0033D01C37